MSRRPLTDSQLGKLLADRDIHEVNEELRVGMKRTARALGIPRDGRMSQRPNLLDEPSTADHKKPTPRKRPDFKWDRKPLAEVRSYGEQIVKGQWEAKGGSDLVGLYAVLHEHVFGVLPLELQQDFLMARASADKLVKDEFAGDALAAQQFVAWCWKRVAKQRKKQPDSDFRPGWRLQFKSRTWLTDYKASGRS